MSALKELHEQTIAIAATFTAEPLLPALRFVLHETELEFGVRFSPYNQVFQELLTPTSLLTTNTGGINVVLVRAEDFVREISDFGQARALIRHTIPQLSDALTQYARRVTVPTVLAMLPPSPCAARELMADIETANATLMVQARSLPGITLLSQTEIDLVSTDMRYDPVSDGLAHIPYTEEHYASLALAITRKVHALRVPAHKVLVLDCDNTLWRGVVGEDGVDGITIPPALAQIQRFATDVQARGALVCLVSKNAERDVFEVFDKRSDMVLKKEHIVAHRINWDSKPNNIVSLARSLNLGLDSFVFMDDNPVECGLMRAELPEVVTLQVPPDEEIDSFLSHLWTFDKIAVTDEDARRTSMYRENAARQELEQSTTNIAEFIVSLNVIIDIARPSDNEWPRAAQLTHRTNQFNFTTLRRTESEMRALEGDGSLVLRVKVSDRFGDYGLVGLVVADIRSDVLVVDTLLLSCRVLGRGVEHAILRHLGEISIERGLSHVHLAYLPTPKNEPARAFAESIAADFRKQESDRVIYCIPADRAHAISHRPGHDPAAVIEALKSEENKASPSSSKRVASTSSANLSQRYENLARSLISGREVLRIERSGHLRARTLPNEPEKPATEIEFRLLALWEEFLGFERLGVKDDYFALGGTSLVAARLFAEITRQFGVRLPLTVILASPTVRALSRHLEAQQIDSQGTLVELRGGGPRNIFLVHDGDGETLLYLNLAHSMPSDLAVFGIEPDRTEGVPLAHGRIEDMAAFYIDQVRRKQPRGPYRLGGMCAGGVIAYEMASQLVRAGEPVEFVALLDAATPQATKWPRRIARQRLGRVAQAFADAHSSHRPPIGRAIVVAGAISRKLVNALRWEIMQRGTMWSVRARFKLLRELLPRRKRWPRFIPELTVRQIYNSAEAQYVPKPLYGVAVVLVRARAGEAGDTPYREIYADETLGWGGITDNLAVVDVEGGHSSMLQEPFVNSLAAAIMPYLTDEAKLAFAGSVETERHKNHRPTAIKEFVPHS